MKHTAEPGTHAAKRRFGGVMRLYGAAALTRFAWAHVCVIGLGGVGSWAAEALARSAIGALTLIDMDHVAESNINRQLHAVDTTLGKAKVLAMAERIHGINRHCAVHAVEDFVSRDNVAALLDGRHHWVIDCADNFRVKAAIIAHCKRAKIKLITIGAAGGLTDPTRIKVADLTRAIHDPLLSRTRKYLRHRHAYSRNPQRRYDVPCVYSEEHMLYPTAGGGVCRAKPGAATPTGLSCAGGLGSAMPVTASFGLVAAAHVLKKLAVS